MQFIPVAKKTLVIRDGVTLYRVVPLHQKHKVWFESVRDTDAYLVHNGELIPIANGKVLESEILVKVDHKRYEKPDPRLFQKYQEFLASEETTSTL